MKRKELAAELRKLLEEADAFVERERARPYFLKGDEKLLELGYLRQGIKCLAERLEEEDRFGRTERSR